MKGKKKNMEFVSQYISSCIDKGYNTPDMIINHAKSRIIDIDILLKQIESLKLERANLLDVIDNFTVTTTTSDVDNIISLYTLSYPNICRFICSQLKISPKSLEELSLTHDKGDVIFCIKQLMEYKILSKSGNVYLRGSKFNQYWTKVLKEHE